MTTQNTLDALSRALQLFCYERGLGHAQPAELLAGPLKPNDRQWLETFSTLWHVLLSVESGGARQAEQGFGYASRMECELIDYQHVSPYRVYVGHGSTQPDGFKSYRAANLYARAQSGAKRIPVYIRDAADVVFWEIRLVI